MEKRSHSVKVFWTECSTHGEKIAVPWSGEALVSACQRCAALFWHTPKDEVKRPLAEQVAHTACPSCAASLVATLVPSHFAVHCPKGHNIVYAEEFFVDEGEAVDMDLWDIYG